MPKDISRLLPCLIHYFVCERYRYFYQKFHKSGGRDGEFSQSEFIHTTSVQKATAHCRTPDGPPVAHLVTATPLE